MKKFVLIVLGLSLASCAPTTQTTTKTSAYDGLSDATSALIALTDQSDKELHFNSMSMNRKDVVAGLTIYRNILVPENGFLTSFNDGTVAYVAEKAEINLDGGGLLCLSTQTKAIDGQLQGSVYQLDKDDKTAIQAIGTGINEGREGAKEMIAQFTSTQKAIGTCTIKLMK